LCTGALKKTSNAVYWRRPVVAFDDAAMKVDGNFPNSGLATMLDWFNVSHCGIGIA
jgi:hypothetical protein